MLLLQRPELCRQLLPQLSKENSEALEPARSLVGDYGTVRAPEVLRRQLSVQREVVTLRW